MLNITRTLTVYEVKAFDLVEGEDGAPRAEGVATATVETSTLDKRGARAALQAANGGEPIPRGLMVKWAPIKKRTYAMPLDDFLANAVVIEETEAE